MNENRREPVAGVTADVVRLMNCWLGNCDAAVTRETVLAAAAGMAVLLDALRQEDAIGATVYERYAREERFVELNSRLIADPHVVALLGETAGFLDRRDIETRFNFRSLVDLDSLGIDSDGALRIYAAHMREIDESDCDLGQGKES